MYKARAFACVPNEQYKFLFLGISESSELSLLACCDRMITQATAVSVVQALL
jgi:hypothetical protein